MALADALDLIRQDWRLRVQSLTPEDLDSLRQMLARAVLEPRDGKLAVSVLQLSAGKDLHVWSALERPRFRFRRSPTKDLATVLVDLRFVVESFVPKADPR